MTCRAKKSWGQHFLHDAGVLRRTVDAIGLEPGQRVLELGAGLGALTAQLLNAGARVVAVERERDMLAALRKRFGEAIELVDADAARLDYAALRGTGDALTVIGNLPYQIASRILVSLAEARQHVARGVFMVQWEVAERLLAPAGSRTRGLLTLLVGRSFEVDLLEKVPPTAFKPPPKVDSAVISLTRSAGLDVAIEADTLAVARAAYAHRRKALRNNIPGGAERLRRAGIDDGLRAEDLSLDDFVRLATTL